MKTTSAPSLANTEEWLAARRELLREEKELTRLRDKIAEKRRRLPWLRVDKPYTFASPRGPLGLEDLFEGRSQLIVYHFMFGPDWDEPCRSCSFVADHFDGTLPHLRARDISFAAISRTSAENIEAFKKRMQWRFPWVSSRDSDFNFDFQVSFTPEEVARGRAVYNFTEKEIPSEELPGMSVFARGDDGAIYRTYSTYSRGLDALMSTYALIDLTPKGRDEAQFEYGMEWVRFHDRYENAPAAIPA